MEGDDALVAQDEGLGTAELEERLKRGLCGRDVCYNTALNCRVSYSDPEGGGAGQSS